MGQAVSTTSRDFSNSVTAAENTLAGITIGSFVRNGNQPTQNTDPPLYRVSLNRLASNKDLITVVKTAKPCWTNKETIFFATQSGNIYYLLDESSHKSRNQPEWFRSIECEDGVGKLASLKEVVFQVPNYNGAGQFDQRGLIGLEFHPNFRKNGKFYVYYTENNSSGNPVPVTVPNPSNPCSLEQTWDYTRHWDHIDTLTEMKFNKSDGTIKHNRTLLRIKRPFSNNNGLNTLNWSNEFDVLLLHVGDGGLCYDPFNLAQNDEMLFGKVISIDVRKHVELPTEMEAIANVNQFCEGQNKIIFIAAKGLRNPVSFDQVTVNKKNIKFLADAGENFAEEILAFDDFYKTKKSSKKSHHQDQDVMTMYNFGWRAWEGATPTMCKVSSVGNVEANNNMVQSVSSASTSTPNQGYKTRALLNSYLTSSNNQPALSKILMVTFPWNVETFQTEKVMEKGYDVLNVKPGTSVTFISDEGYGLTEASVEDGNWVPKENPKYYIEDGTNWHVPLTFNRPGSVYLMDPSNDIMKLKINVGGFNKYGSTANNACVPRVIYWNSEYGHRKIVVSRGSSIQLISDDGMLHTVNGSDSRFIIGEQLYPIGNDSSCNFKYQIDNIQNDMELIDSCNPNTYLEVKVSRGEVSHPEPNQKHTLNVKWNHELGTTTYNVPKGTLVRLIANGNMPHSICLSNPDWQVGNKIFPYNVNSETHFCYDIVDLDTEMYLICGINSSKIRLHLIPEGGTEDLGSCGDNGQSGYWVLARPCETVALQGTYKPFVSVSHIKCEPKLKPSTAVSGGKFYQGSISCLKGYYVFSDLSERQSGVPIGRGLLYRVKPNFDDLQEIRQPELIDIDFQLPEGQSWFVTMGSNASHTRLFLVVSNSQKGGSGIYEIVNCHSSRRNHRHYCYVDNYEDAMNIETPCGEEEWYNTAMDEIPDVGVIGADEQEWYNNDNSNENENEDNWETNSNSSTSSLSSSSSGSTDYSLPCGECGRVHSSHDYKH